MLNERLGPILHTADNSYYTLTDAESKINFHYVHTLFDFILNEGKPLPSLRKSKDYYQKWGEGSVKDSVTSLSQKSIDSKNRKKVPIMTFYSPFTDDSSAQQTTYRTRH